MGKRFTLCVLRHSYGLERAHGPCFRLLLLADQYHWCNSKLQTRCSISKFAIRNEASTSQRGVTCAKASNKHDAEWQLNYEDVGQANNNMDCDPTFTGANSSNEPHLLTQGDLNDIVRDMNLSKKQAELLSSRLKGWNLLHEDTKVCYYRGRHEEFKDFYSQEDGVVFCNDVPLWKFLAMNLSQISGACSLIRQKCAWRWYYSTTETNFPPFLWLMQPTWKLWKHEATVGND